MEAVSQIDKIFAGLAIWFAVTSTSIALVLLVYNHVKTRNEIKNMHKEIQERRED